jgi:hypothetical protein
MKPTLLFLSFAYLFILITPSAHAQKNFYDRRWSDVYQFELKDKPRSALVIVDSIYSKAKKDNNIPQTIKALLYHSKFTYRINEEPELLIVQNLEKEIRSSKAPLKNLLESMLAEVYWQYFKEKRYIFYNRSRLSAKAHSDFRTWDANSFFEEIHLHFQKSLSDAAALQKISIESIKDILVQAEGNRMYRPTLYDLLSHNALDFYETNESLVTKPTVSFDVTDTAYYTHFETTEISITDSLAPQLQALKIYKNLLLFHKQRKDTTAYVQLELERLKYLKREGTIENGYELYKRSLRKLKAEFLKHPVSTIIDFEIATILNSEGNTYNPKGDQQDQYKKRDALAVCIAAIHDFPESDGALKCQVLRETILSKSLHITSEEHVPINKFSRLLVDYKNIDTLFFKVFRVDELFIEEFYKFHSDSSRVAKINFLKPDTAWTTPFPT